MPELHEKPRFKWKIRSIFDSDYTYDELCEELESAMEWPFYTMEEFKKMAREDTERIIGMQRNKVCTTK